MTGSKQNMVLDVVRLIGTPAVVSASNAKTRLLYSNAIPAPFEQ